MKTVERLKELLSKATPGPWIHKPGANDSNSIDAPRNKPLVLGTFTQTHKGVATAYGVDYDDESAPGTSDANRDLIITLRNRAPALIAALEKSVAENKYHRSHFGRLLELSDATDQALQELEHD